MKLFLISDNIDSESGLRMAGVEGVVVHERDETITALQKAVDDPEIAVILITKKLVDLCSDIVYNLKLKSSGHLIVEIPDRHGDSDIIGNIEKYTKESIGFSL
ncbi:MAG: V-type ATP synthase subunit F [Eubacterium sp.]|jgi:V/A-type H+-transporting ATPase subunit F|nr:V-type ATP synthase subunit F [Eubacterium sp.]